MIKKTFQLAIRWIILMALALSTFACSSAPTTLVPGTETMAIESTQPSAATAEPTTPAPIVLVASEKQRQASPDVAEADLIQAADGNSAFAFDLYQAIRSKKDGNLFYSPYSISTALTMVYAGARTGTETQMAGVFHYTLPQAQLHPAFNALDLSLTSSGQEDFTLRIANSIWGQKDFAFVQEYLDTIAQNYGAGLRLVDFAHGDNEQTRKTINDWVSEQTEEKIKELFPAGSIDANTRLVLANAVYFNAKWEIPFSADSTKDGEFYLLDGSPVTVPMMNKGMHVNYAEGENYQAVALPYKGGRMRMVILLPAAGQFEAVESGLDLQFVKSVLAGLATQNVALSMPKFEFGADLDLAETLAGMGMPDAFGGGADFSGIFKGGGLFISKVIHKAYVAVDEEGTEAAAATGVVVGLTAVETFDKAMTVDRPFIFFIQDSETGTILFLGRVMDPTAK